MTFPTEIWLIQKPLRIRFNKIDGCIRVYDCTRHLVVFGPEKHDAIYNTIRYLLNQQSGIKHVISNNYARIKNDSYDSLPLEMTLTLHNVIILFNSVLNKYQNHHYCRLFLEKYLYQLV